MCACVCLCVCVCVSIIIPCVYYNTNIINVCIIILNVGTYDLINILLYLLFVCVFVCVCACVCVRCVWCVCA